MVRRALRVDIVPKKLARSLPEDSSLVAKLPFRADRLDMKVPLSFRTDDGLIEGHCVNVSESGMLVMFEGYVELFTKGELSLLVGEYYISIGARVMRNQLTDYGLAFQVATDNDRQSVAILVGFALGAGASKNT